MLDPSDQLTKDVLGRAQAFVDRKYVSRADERQRAMGLAYVEAERQDLAREMALFAMDEMQKLVAEWLEATIGL